MPTIRWTVAEARGRSLLFRSLRDQGVELRAEVLSPTEATSHDEREETTHLGEVDKPRRQEAARVDAILQPGVAHRQELHGQPMLRHRDRDAR